MEISRFSTNARILAIALLFGLGLAAADTTDPRTVIESDSLELVTDIRQNRFLFEGNVRVAATNLKATCDRMEVISNRTPDSDPDATLGEIGSIEKILAFGNVVITQSGRTAMAGKAEIYPRQGKVILTENPVVKDDRGMTVTGPRMVMLQGERRVLIEGSDGELVEGRPTVTLPSLPDLGFDREDPVAERETEGSP